jgi:spore coat polysaccharide biosynthesis protein SpsF (cytidylyltransferase family)
MQTSVVITARWNSQRLPGKALADINGNPMLWHTVTNCRKTGLQTIVATTVNSQPIVDFCEGNGVSYYAHEEEDDILGRMVKLGKLYKLNTVIRIWGDNPFPIPDQILDTLNFFETHPYKYVVARTGDNYCSVVNANILKQLDKIKGIERHDIHTWMVDNLNSVIINNPSPKKYTVDTQEDLERARLDSRSTT